MRVNSHTRIGAIKFNLVSTLQNTLLFAEGPQNYKHTAVEIMKKKFACSDIVSNIVIEFSLG